MRDSHTLFNDVDSDDLECQKNSHRNARKLTYSNSKLILEPLQVESEVRFGHLIVTPASELSDDSRSHVDDEAI